MRRVGFTLIELLALVAIVAIVAALSVPSLASSQRASNERNASTSLKTLSSAEADFRANDRDQNRVNDFWTGDVKGLYTMTGAKVRGARGDQNDPPVRLIELSIAAADIDPTLVPAGGENMDLARFAVSAPKAGHWYYALESDPYPEEGNPDHAYRADTGGTVPMGKCHHLTRFGFISAPASSWSGKYLFLLNENNTIFRRTVSSEVWGDISSPPGRDAIPKEYRDFPDDNGLKSFWSKPF
jgi:type II secretory pathway pseudopilin PulG